jgi:HK97 family phage portal protein
MAKTKNIILSTLGRAVASVKAALTLRDPIEAWMAGTEWDGGLKHVPNPYERAIYVYAAISGVAEAVAGVDLQVQTLTNDPVASPLDPSVTLLEKPNGLQDRASFFEATAAYLQLDGQVFWFTLDSPLQGGKRIDAVYIARDDEMNPHVVDGRLVAWKYQPAGTGSEIPLPLDQVCRHYFVNPRDPLGGMSCIRAAQLSIDQHVYASEYNAAVFLNGADPGSVYETDHVLDPDQVEQMRDRILEAHGGHKKARSPMILWGGVKWKQGAASMKDMEWLAGKKMTRDEILTALKVPPVIAGIYETATLNNSREQVLLFWDHRGIPLVKRFVDAWNGFVQPRVDASKKVIANLMSVEALKLRAVEATESVLGLQEHGIPLNDLIDVYELPFEKKPWGAVPLAPAGKLPIDVIYAEADAATAADSTPEGGDPDEDLADPSSRARKRLGEYLDVLGNHLAGEEKSDRDRARQRTWWQSFAGLRRASRNRWRAFLQRQRDEMIDRLANTPMPGGKGGKPSGQKQSTDDWLDAVLIDLAIEDGRIEVLARFEFRLALEFGGTQAVAEAGASAAFQFNLEAPAVRAHLKRQVIKVRKVNRTTRRAIRAALLRGLDAGETLTEISERVAGAMNVRADKHSWRIANTEMQEAVGAGRHEGMRQAGVKSRRWITSGLGVAPNGPVRKSHYGAEQTTRLAPVGIDERFTLRDPETGDESHCDFPGQSSLPPGERINCSCMVVAADREGARCLTWEEFVANRRLAPEPRS